MHRRGLLVVVLPCIAVVACGGHGSSTSDSGGSDATGGTYSRGSTTAKQGSGGRSSSTLGGATNVGGSGGMSSVIAGGSGSSGNTSSPGMGGMTSNGGTFAGGTTATSTSSAGGIGGAESSIGGAATGGTTTTSGTAGTAGVAGSTNTEPVTIETLDIADVWSGHPVAFALVTRNNRQFAAYYDSQRRMTVASRTLGSTAWSYKVLPSTLGWDSHNYVAMALDSADQIHLSGNMHGVPLVYFRTTTPFDITSLATLNSMVGVNETQVTYPIFFDGPTGDLVFEYRDGSSGNGNTIFNTYSTTSQTWKRTLNSALLNGTSVSMNAYPEGPVLGPDGYWHLVWVWRNTSDASTNHDLSYAKTQDLVHWFKADGTALTLPITPTTGDIVDPVPVNGGMINNNTRIGFDAQNRPIVAYHKFDANGFTQLYEARLENGVWVSHCATDWTYRWAFGGTGTLVFQIGIDEGPKLLPDGTLIQNYYHSQYGGQGTLVLNSTTLRAENTLTPPLRPYPQALTKPESSYKDPSTQEAMVVRWTTDSGSGSDTSITYMLRWETLPSNKDVARTNIPPATKLRIYGFR